MNSTVAVVEADGDVQATDGDLGLAAHAEKLIGPVHGFYLACYTVPSRTGFLGYAKVNRHAAESVWDPQHAMDKIFAGPFESSELAMQGVIQKATTALRARSTRSNRLFRLLLKLA